MDGLSLYNGINGPYLFYSLHFFSLLFILVQHSTKNYNLFVLTVCSHVCVSLKIMEKLLSELTSERRQLLAESFLDMIHELLHSNQLYYHNLAANSVRTYHNLAAVPQQMYMGRGNCGGGRVLGVWEEGGVLGVWGRKEGYNLVFIGNQYFF